MEWLLTPSEMARADNKLMCDPRYRELYYKHKNYSWSQDECNEVIALQGKYYCSAQLSSDAVHLNEPCTEHEHYEANPKIPIRRFDCVKCKNEFLMAAGVKG